MESYKTLHKDSINLEWNMKLEWYNDINENIKRNNEKDTKKFQVKYQEQAGKKLKRK